jgi:F-type H+-transporting ATPase subunit gamma
MSERLEDLARRLASVRELQDIVGAMASLAAVRLQQAQASLSATRSYAEVVRDALRRATSRLPPDRPAVAAGAEQRAAIVLLFGAEHGFTGAFNRRLVETLDAKERQIRLVIGTRAATLCRDRGIAVDWATPMATNIGGVIVVARRVAAELRRRLVAGADGPIEAVRVSYRGGGRSEILRETLFPIEPDHRNAESIPALLNLPAPRLVELLIDEYLLGAVSDAAMESIAGENGARLATMQMARHNLDERRTELESEERLLRQDEITTEMLDVVTGAAAIVG